MLNVLSPNSLNTVPGKDRGKPRAKERAKALDTTLDTTWEKAGKDAESLEDTRTTSVLLLKSIWKKMTVYLMSGLMNGDDRIQDGKILLKEQFLLWYNLKKESVNGFLTLYLLLNELPDPVKEPLCLQNDHEVPTEDLETNGPEIHQS